MEMFCCELKLVVAIGNKWIYNRFTRQRLVLDFGTKKKFKEQNPLNFNDLCCICGFELGVTEMSRAQSAKESYCDFVIKKEHHFLQNIFSKEVLKWSESIFDSETYYRFFKTFIYISTHLCLKYNKESLIENVDDEEILKFTHYLRKFQK